MSRITGASEIAALYGGVINCAWFIKAEFRSATAYWWTGYGTKTHDGHDWLGVGTLGTISGIDESSRPEATGATFTLNGIDSEMVAKALHGDTGLGFTEAYQGRPITLYLAILDDSDAIIQFIQIYAGRMDTMTIQDGETATISLTSESYLIDLFRRSGIRYTDQAQQQLHSGDLGMEFVASIQDKPIKWGQQVDPQTGITDPRKPGLVKPIAR